MHNGSENTRHCSETLALVSGTLAPVPGTFASLQGTFAVWFREHWRRFLLRREETLPGPARLSLRSARERHPVAVYFPLVAERLLLVPCLLVPLQCELRLVLARLSVERGGGLGEPEGASHVPEMKRLGVEDGFELLRESGVGAIERHE
eukprot:CAMPEP_0198202674 /NCGR_PEP_ID=MMETSP1445-20131203/5881_1 /TAXON_ID=36898 /ORGANISM="Pyramimonas sp., Strain CCMP2087" /LENGTH=148 /DNA_ID=CAMNT_0043873719 /DNA_START=307 /DNA_END=750 /DNA_ORIENTATION=-